MRSLATVFFVLVLTGGCARKNLVEMPRDSNINNNRSSNTREYEEAFVQFVQGNNVQVRTVDSDLAIVFRMDEVRDFIRLGCIVPVSASCAKDEGENCDFDSRYQLYVGAGPKKTEVVALNWKWFESPDKIWIAHGPGDGDRPSGRLAIKAMYKNKQVAFMELKTDNQKSIQEVSRLKRGDTLEAKSFLREDKPYSAFVNGVEMRIVAIRF